MQLTVGILRVWGVSLTVPLKFDHPPLLAPGRYLLSLQEIESLCVRPFTGQAQTRRERLFYALDEIIQQLLTVKLPSEVFVDGSYFTEKPDPGDVDCLIVVEYSVSTQSGRTWKLAFSEPSQSERVLGF